MPESMPYRGDIVRQLCDANAQQHDFRANPEDPDEERPAFPQGEENDVYRLEFLKQVVIPFLNAVDGGNWGLCTKTEQNNRIPVDILMWRPTREIVDCLTGTGGAWQTFPGLPPDTWLWTAVDSGEKPPVDPPVEDSSRSVWYPDQTISLGQLAYEVSLPGTLVPQPNNQVVLITPIGSVISVQPNGRVELRPAGTVGAYELAEVDPTLEVLRYSGAGGPYFVLTRRRDA